MKTAEEWVKIFGGDVPSTLTTVSQKDIATIQIDAYKQGMTDAAKVVKTYHHGCTTSEVRSLFHNTIISARDNKKAILNHE